VTVPRVTQLDVEWLARWWSVDLGHPCTVRPRLHLGSLEKGFDLRAGPVAYCVKPLGQSEKRALTGSPQSAFLRVRDDVWHEWHEWHEVSISLETLVWRKHRIGG